MSSFYTKNSLFAVGVQKKSIKLRLLYTKNKVKIDKINLTFNDWNYKNGVQRKKTPNRVLYTKTEIPIDFTKCTLVVIGVKIGSVRIENRTNLVWRLEHCCRIYKIKMGVRIENRTNLVWRLHLKLVLNGLN